MRQVGEKCGSEKTTTTNLPQQSIQFHSCACSSVFFLAASVCSVLVPAANSIPFSSLKTTQTILAAAPSFTECENNYLSHHRRKSKADGETGRRMPIPKRGPHAITAAAGSHLAEGAGWWTFSWLKKNNNEEGGSCCVSSEGKWK